jgi:hypothetical protein
VPIHGFQDEEGNRLKATHNSRRKPTVKEVKVALPARLLFLESYFVHVNPTTTTSTRAKTLTARARHVAYDNAAPWAPASSVNIPDSKDFDFAFGQSHQTWRFFSERARHACRERRAKKERPCD